MTKRSTTRRGTPSRENLHEKQWRTGRYKTWQAKLIYAILDDNGKASNADPVIGQMESPALARHVVNDHNGWFD